MKTLLLLLALSGPLGFQQAVLALSGASCVEELSEEEMARYQSLAAHPVDLNAAGRSRLLSTGLLTPFQVASLLDYRTRTGAILSWTELGLVDGFSPELVAALQEFFVLGFDGAPPGRREDRRVRQSLTLRGGARANGTPFQYDNPAAVGGAKYELTVGERAAFYWSSRTTYSDPQFSVGTLSAAYYGRRTLGQLIVGNFGARFGQGLVQWSGFALSGYNSLGAFRRNGTGFSPTGSYSPALFGLAADWHFGPWRLSAGYSLAPSSAALFARSFSETVVAGQPIANLTYVGRSISAGLTATGEAASLEARLALPAWSLFGEFALRYPRSLLSVPAPSFSSDPPAAHPWTAQAVAGAIWIPAYGHRTGIVGRWLGYGAEYSGVAFGYEGPALSATADVSVRPDTRAFQLKSLFQWHPTFVLNSTTLQPQLRAQLRWRPADAAPLSSSALPVSSSPNSSAWASVFPFAASGLRMDLRGMLTATIGPWFFAGRYDAVFGKGPAWNWYVETGWKSETFSAYLRGGIFKVDNWDDRIYVYERDAPGSFTVPSRYGRGWDAALYAAWRPARRHSLWLRLETVRYPWNLTPKDARLELRLQYRYQR